VDELPTALAPLSTYKQFLVYKIVPRDDGKTDKLPINPYTLQIMPKGSDWHNKPEYLTTSADAIIKAAMCGPSYGVAFLLTVNDPFFLLDLDGCLINGKWSPTAVTLCDKLDGAAVEVSCSGAGLHIIGSGVVPDHSCKHNDLGIELYTERRMISLTGTQAHGSADIDCSVVMSAIVAAYFPPVNVLFNATWTTKPRDEWTSPGDNKKLLEKAIASSSNAVKFGTAASFNDLWTCNVEVLDTMYPPLSKSCSYDRSTADAALAQHLAFWCGCNCDHIWELMWMSALKREKWNWHDTYLQDTITRAISLQSVVYTSGNKERVKSAFDVPKLNGSPEQVLWAESIREEKLLSCGDDQAMIDTLCLNHGPATMAGFWIDKKELPATELVARAEPAPIMKTNNVLNDGPIFTTGFQYMSLDKQAQHFNGCVYIQDVNQVFTPTGALLKTEQFNVTYGGYMFQMSEERESKPTDKAYKAFTESPGIRYEMAQAVSLRPDLPEGKLYSDEGTVYMNSYIAVNTEQVEGDCSRFFEHMNKLIPNKRDQVILTSYMAAVVQHKGHKFQWSPVIQGVQGNGKTLFTRCVAFCIGKKYYHAPFASEITEKFNDWLFENIFIGIEDIVIADNKQDVMNILKPMISNDQLAMRAMQSSQKLRSCCANFMLNMNPKTGFRIEPNERRYAPFYTAQQSAEDIQRDGLDGNYFPELYTWLRNGGYANINYYLNHYDIPTDFNPAVTAGGKCSIAPHTSSTIEAQVNSLGAVEQEIVEAVEQGQMGFSGGWISSTHLDKLLMNLNLQRRISHNRRRAILSVLGYEIHPSLTNGRVNNVIPCDAAKSRLFVHNSNESKNLTIVSEIVKAYEMAQPMPQNQFTQS